MFTAESIEALKRIADALERLSPPPVAAPDLSAADAYVWHADPDHLEPVPIVNRVDIQLLQGIERQREQLMDNTRRFARGFPANNALLWGARGTGKSSLVKAVHATINAEAPGTLLLVEIHREDIPTLPRCLRLLKESGRRAVLRPARRRLQVAEGGAGRRHRGAAGQRGVLRHLQPPPPDGPRHDRQ